jgi:hypothetical protein
VILAHAIEGLLVALDLRAPAAENPGQLELVGW